MIVQLKWLPQTMMLVE